MNHENDPPDPPWTPPDDVILTSPIAQAANAGAAAFTRQARLPCYVWMHLQETTIIDFETGHEHKGAIPLYFVTRSAPLGLVPVFTVMHPTTYTLPGQQNNDLFCSIISNN